MEQTPTYLKPVGALELFDSEHVIWQTGAQAFSYQGNQDIPAINNVVLNIKKPTPADYLGFGEQGGRTVLKKPTFMNYFCKISRSGCVFGTNMSRLRQLQLH